MRRLKFLAFASSLAVMLCAGFVFAQTPSGSSTATPSKAITKAQLDQLVSAGMDSTQLAGAIEQRGIGFAISGEYLGVLREKGAQPILLKILAQWALKLLPGPLDKDLLRESVAAGVDGTVLAKAVRERGIDFDPVADYMEALQKAGAQDSLLAALREATPVALSRDQVLKLVAGGVPSTRVVALVTRRGIGFRPSDDFLDTLRIAGAKDDLLRVLHNLKPQVGQINVETLADAEIYLDDKLQGRTGKDGHFAIADAEPGPHTLKVSAAHKKDHTEQLEIAVNQTLVANAKLDDAPLRTLTGHTGSVLSVAFSSDGHMLASGGEDSTVKLWDVAAGKEARTLKGHDNEVWSVAYSPDGRSLASGSSDDTSKLWDAATGREVRTLGGFTKTVLTVAFSPDGHILATGSGDARDSSAVGENNSIRLWDTSTGQQLHLLVGHKDAILYLAFSPDGRTLASGSTDGTIKLWDPVSGKEIRTLWGHKGAVRSVAFSRDGRTLASGSFDQTVKLWDLASGQELRTLRGHKDFVTDVAFSPSGSYVASASSDSTVKVWDIAKGEEVRSMSCSEAVESISYSPDGHLLATANKDGHIEIWQVAQ